MFIFLAKGRARGPVSGLIKREYLAHICAINTILMAKLSKKNQNVSLSRPTQAWADLSQHGRTCPSMGGLVPAWADLSQHGRTCPSMGQVIPGGGASSPQTYFEQNIHHNSAVGSFLNKNIHHNSAVVSFLNKNIHHNSAVVSFLNKNNTFCFD